MAKIEWEGKMHKDKKTGRIVGLLFIIGFAGIPAVVLTGPVLSAPDYLFNITAHENQMRLGVLFQLIMAFACAGIGIWLELHRNFIGSGLYCWTFA